MASSKGILRSFVVLVLVFAVGFLGLWFLSGSEIKIKDQKAYTSKTQIDEKSNDQFSNIGGQTPQETLKLLIFSLENKNLTLAAKYFTPENRETASEDLARLDNTKLLGDLVKDLKNIKLGKLSDETHYIFNITDQDGQTAAELELIKNDKGFWKITSL